MDLSKYRELYSDEAQRHLCAFEGGLEVLTNSPQGSESLEDLCRAAHTLRGMSATMGYDRVALLAGEAEMLVERVREGAVPLSGKLADVLSDCLRALRMLVLEATEGRATEVELGNLLHQIGAYGDEEGG